MFSTKNLARKGLIKLTHELSFRNINLKMDNYTEGEWSIHGSKN